MQIANSYCYIARPYRTSGYYGAVPDLWWPELVDGFTRKTLIAMVEGVREQAINLGLITEVEWSKGIADLYRSAASDGTFCYNFFKAVGKKS